MRRRILRFWLDMALRAMERASGYKIELLSDRRLDDLILAYKILYKAVHHQPAPVFRGVTGRVDAAVASWEMGKRV